MKDPAEDTGCRDLDQFPVIARKAQDMPGQDEGARLRGSLRQAIGFRGPIENQPEYPAGMGGQATLTLPREQVMAAFRKDQQVLRAALVRAGVL